MSSEPHTYCPPPPEALKTIHADDWIIVADKPGGLLSVPGRGPEKAVCAVSILTERHGEILTVHRLDMDTSGVMVFARTKEAQRHLSRSFEKRLTDKLYEALVDGQMKNSEGTINAAIAKYSLKRPLRHLDPEGREAITHWRVRETLPGQTRLELTPETGRSHQLRLHLASIGHPILGDVFYGDPKSHTRLCLHALSLEFPHPDNDVRVRFEASVPF